MRKAKYVDVSGYLFCVKGTAAQAERNRRRAAGMCIRCGMFPPLEKYRACTDCRAREIRESQEQLAFRKENGFELECLLCGESYKTFEGSRSKKLLCSPACYKKDHYNKNKAHYDARRAEWSKVNNEKQNLYKARAVAKRYDYYREMAGQHSNERRIRLLGNSGSHTKQEWIDLKDKFDNKCLRCGCINKQLTRDHIVPVVKGGSDSIENIQPLCRTCNSKKGTNTIDYRGLNTNAA